MTEKREAQLLIPDPSSAGLAGGVGCGACGVTAGLSSPEPEDGGTVARDAAFLPDGVTPGATNPPESGRSPIGSGNDGSGDLRARLAGLVRQPFDGVVSTPTASYANAVADAVLADGFRRVVEDGDTLSKIATVLAAADGLPITPEHLAAPFAERPLYVSKALAIAGAVVRALREETSKHTSGADVDLRERCKVAGQVRASDPPDACCPRCTARTGSCVRCGVRDAVAWELCGPCDREVEAEVAGGVSGQ